MLWNLPGTTLQAPRSEADRAKELFENLFLAGGLTLSQVSSITGLEPYAIQNWVKRGFLPPPKNKRYDLEQLCRIVTINMLKGALTLERICSLMCYINGDPADESDDLIDDAELYFMFVRLAARARHIGGNQDWEAAISDATASYAEPIPGAKDRVQKVLRLMLMAWISARFRLQVEDMVAQLDATQPIKE